MSACLECSWNWRVRAAVAFCGWLSYNDTMAAQDGFEFSVAVAAPQSAMWKVITNHLRWCEWMPSKEVVLETPGSPEQFGLGAVRVFKTIGGRTTAREEVVGWDPPHSMSYILHASFPMKNYRSTMTLIPEGSDSCRLFWRSNWESAIPLWLGGKLSGKLVRRMLHSAAKKMALAAQQET